MAAAQNETASAEPPASSSGFETVAIVGLGLMGASLGLCLRTHCPDVRILGYARREESIREALDRDMIDFGSTDPAEILPDADITVLCVPIQTTVDFARANAHLWRAGSVVTDIGSIKTAIIEGARPHLSGHGVHFVGSHPMAGTENSGLASAEHELYAGGVVFITESPDDCPDAVRLVCKFWEAIGMEPHRLLPEPHDMLVARTSHVLHLLSFAAARAYIGGDISHLATGSGFRDFTRIAASSPDMWTEIFQMNRDNVLAALDEFMQEIDYLRTTLTDGAWSELWDYLAASRQSRRNWYAQWQRRREKSS